ncbi:MAG: tripartite tricarboxylate transporter TctB family protein [Pseudomonadota bacterium]
MSHTPKARLTLRKAMAPLVIVVFAGLAIWQSTLFDRVPPILKRGIQPSDFPQLIAGLMICLALVLPFTDRDKAPEPLRPSVHLTLALMAVFALLMGIDLFLALGVFALCLAFAWGERRWAALALVGLAVPFAVFLLFDTVFEIRFPRGILTTLWYD